MTREQLTELQRGVFDRCRGVGLSEAAAMAAARAETGANAPITESQLDAMIANAFGRDAAQSSASGGGTTTISEAELDNLIAGAFGRKTEGGAR
jgi:hypothetical protein